MMDDFLKVFDEVKFVFGVVINILELCRYQYIQFMSGSYLFQLNLLKIWVFNCFILCFFDFY